MNFWISYAVWPDLTAAAKVTSQNNFPMGSGIASSASAFAALSLAASKAAGLNTGRSALSRLARRGSGSACRSIPAGIVEWHAGNRDEDSFAEQLAPPEYWDLVDCLAVISEGHKAGWIIRWTSIVLLKPAARNSRHRFRQAFRSMPPGDSQPGISNPLADVIEQDSNLMHSVMCTSRPELDLLDRGHPECDPRGSQHAQKGYWKLLITIDAGPNVHVITLKDVSCRR